MFFHVIFIGKLVDTYNTYSLSKSTTTTTISYELSIEYFGYKIHGVCMSAHWTVYTVHTTHSRMEILFNKCWKTKFWIKNSNHRLMQ